MPIQTVLDLSGQWASGGAPGPVISVNGNALSVDMSAYNRPTASGSILDSSDISVHFPDDKTYTGQLQAPSVIHWSNNSTWIKVPILTTIDLNGTWASGGIPGPHISVNGAAISIDMSAYGRPKASGTILDASDITVTFPDDNTYTGKLQPPATIQWSNNSAWTKVAVSTSTLVDLNGQWASGGVLGPQISVDGKKISVDMSFYNRPAASGSILDFADITVTFPDDKSYTGKLQLPGTIAWSNDSTWVKVNTLFSSNFDSASAGSPPLQTEAVGTARVEGPPNSVTVVNPPFSSSSRWLKITGSPASEEQVASFVGQFTQSDGVGVYDFSAELFVPTGSTVCSISFETPDAEEIMHVDFTSDNKIRIDDLVEFGSFKRDQVFIMQASLNISATQSTAHVAVSGGGAVGSMDYNIPEFGQRLSLQFSAIRVWKGVGDVGVFYATRIIAGREA